MGRGHCGKLCFRLPILRDGKLLAAFDLFDQIREGCLGFFKGNCLHSAKTVTRIAGQDQSNSWPDSSMGAARLTSMAKAFQGLRA